MVAIRGHISFFNMYIIINNILPFPQEIKNAEYDRNGFSHVVELDPLLSLFIAVV